MKKFYLLFLFFAIQIIFTKDLYSAPLESGYAIAPSPSASPEEKASAYNNARSLLLTAAAKYEKTPYRYGGLDRNGLDCSGLVYISFRDALGISVPRNTEGLYAWVEKIPLEDALPGDLLFFVTVGSRVSHVGIYTGNRRFIHSASEGSVTGVIFSSLEERYWSRTFTGAGRVFPAAEGSGSKNSASPVFVESSKKQKEKINALMGVGIAPTWDLSLSDNNIIRGFGGQFRLGKEFKPFGKSMIFGLEARPEWDGSLGVFRIPITVSWGLDDKLRIFAGPALSFGNAALDTNNGSRLYTGGTAWFGSAGITKAPFSLSIAGTSLAPYIEFAWQSYRNAENFHLAADFTAGFRLSTGLRLTWKI